MAKFGAHQRALYDAEMAIEDRGRRFRSIEETQAWLDDVLNRQDIEEDVIVKRSPTNGSCASREERVIVLCTRDRNAVAVCHELAHVLSPATAQAHGVEFARIYLDLLRTEVGFFEYAELRNALRADPAFEEIA